MVYWNYSRKKVHQKQRTYTRKSIVLFAIGAIPVIPILKWNSVIIVTKPTIDFHLNFRPATK